MEGKAWKLSRPRERVHSDPRDCEPGNRWGQKKRGPGRRVGEGKDGPRNKAKVGREAPRGLQPHALEVQVIPLRSWPPELQPRSPPACQGCSKPARPQLHRDPGKGRGCGARLYVFPLAPGWTRCRRHVGCGIKYYQGSEASRRSQMTSL